jgi:hypothetical protein
MDTSRRCERYAFALKSPRGVPLFCRKIRRSRGYSRGDFCGTHRSKKRLVARNKKHSFWLRTLAPFLFVLAC